MQKITSKKSILSIILCVALMLTFLNSTAFAEAAEPSEASQFIRLFGTDRYKTAAEISKHGWEKSQYAVIARGDDFADALSAGPLARKYDAPILLTQTDDLSSDVLDELERLEVEKVFIVGGTGAVSEDVENTIKEIKINDLEVTVERIYGDDRLETSVKVAEEIGEITEIAIATGYDYPDALSIAPIASSKGMPILLTAKDSLSESVKAYIDSNKDKIQKTYIIGGDGVVTSSIEGDVVNPVRLGGSDRFETNIEVMAAFAEEMDFESIYVAVGDGLSGDEFADALSGAVLAAKTSSPVVLMYKTVPAVTQGFLALASSDKAKVIALGGDAVVPDDAADTLIKVIKTPLIASNLMGAAVRGTEKEFQVATAAKEARDQLVRVKVTLTEGKDIASIDYKEAADGKYYPLSFDENGEAWYGPEEGFPLSDIVSDFKVSFNKTGNVSYKLEVVRVSDEAVLTFFAGSIEVAKAALEGGDAEAYVVPENFNTNLSETYVGYNVGWNLTDAVDLSDVEKMEISLLDEEGNILVTNVSTDKIFELDTKQFSTPFNINKEIDFSDEYWALGEWAGAAQEPASAQIKITTIYGDNYTVVNENLAIVEGHESVADYLGE